MEIITNPPPVKICVCAGTKEQTDELTQYICEFPAGMETDVIPVYRGDEIIGRLREMPNGFDLCVLCGRLPGMPAEEVAALLQVMREHTDVILMGGNMDFTPSSRENPHIYYLPGTVINPDFARAVGRMLLRYRLNHAPVARIRTPDGALSISLQSIAYAARKGRGVCYVLRDGRAITGVTVRGKLMEELDALSHEPLFLSCGVSTVVNIALVRRLTENAIILRDGRVLPVPRAALKEFGKRLDAAWEENFL